MAAGGGAVAAADRRDGRRRWSAGGAPGRSRTAQAAPLREEVGRLALRLRRHFRRGRQADVWPSQSRTAVAVRLCSRAAPPNRVARTQRAPSSRQGRFPSRNGRRGRRRARRGAARSGRQLLFDHSKRSKCCGSLRVRARLQRLTDERSASRQLRRAASSRVPPLALGGLAAASGRLALPQPPLRCRAWCPSPSLARRRPSSWWSALAPPSSASAPGRPRPPLRREAVRSTRPDVSTEQMLPARDEQRDIGRPLTTALWSHGRPPLRADAACGAEGARRRPHLRGDRLAPPPIGRRSLPRRPAARRWAMRRSRRRRRRRPRRRAAQDHRLDVR